MESQIKVYNYPDGSIQRVQLVTLDSWQQLQFMHLPYAQASLDCFAHIYRTFLVPVCPWIFGNLVMFHLPEDVAVPYPFSTGRWGNVSSALTAAAAGLQKNVRFHKGIPTFRNQETKLLWQELEKRNCIRLIRGKLPFTTAIPVSAASGYLSQTETDARLKVNASFFIMDSFDCATVYDHIGTVLGLCVRNGIVTNPPLFQREALLVHEDGRVSVDIPKLQELQLEIGKHTFLPGKNARLYSRPEYAVTPPSKKTKLVIVGTQVAAVSTNACVPVPASGFVLCVDTACEILPGDRVIYHGMENIVFGIQVGNSILRNGEPTLEFRSRFYNIYKLQPVPFPPSLYPMDFDNARAARIALGADRAGKPMLLWAEGAAKIGQIPGKNSRGASLKDMAFLCQDLGFHNAINLDGGGSAQILWNNQRALQISDRNTDGTEAERPVPLGLMVP